MVYVKVSAKPSSDFYYETCVWFCYKNLFTFGGFTESGLAKSSECSSYPEIDFDNVPQYWSTKVLPKWTKFEEIMYKSSKILGNI